MRVSRDPRWNYLALLALAGVFAFVAPLPPSPNGAAPDPLVAPAAEGTEDDPHARAEMEFMMLRDPRTNAIPNGIRQAEARFARRLPIRRPPQGGARATGIQAVTWTERGPNNVGGRSRTFAVDVAAPTTLIAGGVGGGIWRSTNDGASWSLRTAPAQIHSSTCIAQDRRAGKTNIWYVGSGEIRGSTTNDTRWGSLYRGDGIFKSTDGGVSWTLLSSTISGTPQTTNSFDFVINVATDPSNPVQDEVYAATYNGIYRSVDGGASWAVELPSDSGFTDVAVTPAGIVYAHTRNSGLARLWRHNGVAWAQIQPGTFPTIANRIVIGLAPSNPNAVYFFVQGANTSPQVNGHQLWKYAYVSGDGTGAGGTWDNRAANLPNGMVFDTTGDINTQTGYDMTIHVKPNDENFVILGGTNLYRSTNGWSGAPNTASVIGGYLFYGAGNHHPDMQGGTFSPSNPNVYYSSHDGGVTKAADITLANMVWTSLNNGYNVTQFYSVAIAPESGSNLILAGAQDNGSQLGNAPGASNWTHVFGGDGTVVEVAPLADDRIYTQWQSGPINRQLRDGSSATDMRPTGSANALFVNPIALDPSNSQVLYYAAGVAANTSRIWRNDSAPIATTTTGWTNLAATEVGAGSGYIRRITAMGVSTTNDPSVLYYGTVDGLVFRAVAANTATPVVTNITPPSLNGGTNIGGFVRCIAVDPTDANKALLVFGNYNFLSLWYTTNGGASWTDVEGNLAGPSGPSTRWATMFYVGGQLQVFLATSIGVLSTTALAGGSTVWVQEAATELGNVICGYMDYRPSDRTLAVATHGRGVFTGQITGPVGVEDGPAPGTRLALYQNYPNPASAGTTTIAYELPRAGDVSLRVYDVSGREVATLVNGHRERGRHQVRFGTRGLANGAYYYVLRAGGTVETRKLTLKN